LLFPIPTKIDLLILFELGFDNVSIAVSHHPYIEILYYMNYN